MSAHPSELADKRAPGRGDERLIITSSPSSLQTASANCSAPRSGLIHILASLSFFSWIGCLTRLGLTALFTFEGAEVFPLIWSQALGTFVIGLVVHRKSEIIQIGGDALFIGLHTGLPGSITTFSSWMLQTFEGFSNLGGNPRSGVYNAIAGLSQIFITLSFSYFSLCFGRTISSILPPLCHSPPSPPVYSSFIRASSFTILLLYLGLLFLLIFTSSSTFFIGRRTVFALLLAPPGTMLRWYLSRFNSRAPHIPVLGTFVANMLATAVLALSYLLQRLFSSSTVTVIQCQALQALEDGFCGSLSTVSTFIAEIDTAWKVGREHGKVWKGFKRELEWGSLYFVGSIAIGQGLMVLVLGAGWWSSGGLKDVCVY